MRRQTQEETLADSAEVRLHLRFRVVRRLKEFRDSMMPEHFKVPDDRGISPGFSPGTRSNLASRCYPADHPAGRKSESILEPCLADSLALIVSFTRNRTTEDGVGTWQLFRKCQASEARHL